MATLASSEPLPSPPFNQRRKTWARRVERICCQTISYFPLCFVYGLTSWAVWVEVTVSTLGVPGGLGYAKAAVGILLYGMAVVSYTIAVFTDPGSPLDPRRNVAAGRKGGGYEGLPTYEDEESGAQMGMSTVTAKSSGKQRYCKKCQSVKPDRSHHCSTCGKCVLKMDHHCPWLATCAGLRNYKPFLLFLTYVSLFCWICFAVSASWVWAEFTDQVQMDQGMRVVHTILLAVLGGIIGLVLSGFTGWHFYLAMTGQTTIESLEKTRYLSPLKKNMEQQFQAQSHRHYIGQAESSNPDEEQTLTEHLKEIHANALPGVLRPEEGESGTSTPKHQPPWGPSWQDQHEASNSSPAKASLHRSYASLEAQREQDRYESYLDEQDSEKLPNAFDLGWKRNLLHVFGEKPLLWFLPVCNTTGDGWMWDVSHDWLNARETVAMQRQARERERQWWDGQSHTQNQAPPAFEPPKGRNWKWAPGQGFVDPARSAPAPPRVSRSVEGDVPMQPLDRRKASESPDHYDTSSDEEAHKRAKQSAAHNTSNWNDLPEEFLAPSSGGAPSRSRSTGRRKGD